MSKDTDEEKTVVVCGATGHQGGAVVKHMLKRPNWNVIAITRNPGSARAQALKERGVTLRQADLKDRSSLIGAFKESHSVFGVTQPWSPDYKKCNPNAEIEQGRNIADACAQTGVKHVVVSTAAHIGEGRTGIPHVDSKLDVERFIMDSGIPYTFLRPAQFMDNIGQPYFPVKRGMVRGFVDGDAKVPYIATNDIGAIAALAFDNPARCIGEGINLIGDFVSGRELCDTLSWIRKGEPFTYKTVPKIVMRVFSKEFYAMRIAFEEFGRPPYLHDVTSQIEQCRHLYPDLMSVEQYLLSQGFDSMVL
jgi:uncharacterized protein YbjT (DUF2867 family)